MPRQYTRYDFASGQRYLLVVRIFEIVLALIEIILLSYSGVHHGYWNNLGSALGFGITASILTVPIAAVTLAKYNDARATTSRHRFFLYYMRVITEIILIAFWTAAFISMLLPKGKDYRQLFDKPPYVWWDIAILISVFQIFFFTWSAVLVHQEKYLTDPVPFMGTTELGRIPVQPPPVRPAAPWWRWFTT